MVRSNRIHFRDSSSNFNVRTINHLWHLDWGWPVAAYAQAFRQNASQISIFYRYLRPKNSPNYIRDSSLLYRVDKKPQATERETRRDGQVDDKEAERRPLLCLWRLKLNEVYA